MAKVKVLFVCLGNICRSPLAEAIFKDQLAKSGIDEFVEADSCGTSHYHVGEPADERTMLNAQKNGIRINHRGRQLHQNDLEAFDLILAMDYNNYQNILRLPRAHVHENKVRLMREFDPLRTHEDVPDPYYGGDQGFQEVFDILDRSVVKLIEFLQREYLQMES